MLQGQGQWNDKGASLGEGIQGLSVYTHGPYIHPTEDPETNVWRPSSDQELSKIASGIK